MALTEGKTVQQLVIRDADDRVDMEEIIDAENSDEREFLTQNKGAPLIQKNTALKYIFRIILFISPYIAGILFCIFLTVFYHVVLSAPAIYVLNALPPNSTIMLDLHNITKNLNLHGNVSIQKDMEGNSNYLFNSAPPENCDSVEFYDCSEAKSIITGYDNYRMSAENNYGSTCMYYLNGVGVDSGSELEKISSFPQLYAQDHFFGPPFNGSDVYHYNHVQPCTITLDSESTPSSVSTSGLYLLPLVNTVSIPHYTTSSCRSIDPFDPIPSDAKLLVHTSMSENFCSMYIINKGHSYVLACFLGSLAYISVTLIVCDVMKLFFSIFFKKKTD